MNSKPVKLLLLVTCVGSKFTQIVNILSSEGYQIDRDLRKIQKAVIESGNLHIFLNTTAAAAEVGLNRTWN